MSSKYLQIILQCLYLQFVFTNRHKLFSLSSVAFQQFQPKIKAISALLVLIVMLPLPDSFTGKRARRISAETQLRSRCELKVQAVQCHFSFFLKFSLIFFHFFSNLALFFFIFSLKGRWTVWKFVPLPPKISSKFHYLDNFFNFCSIIFGSHCFFRY